MHAAELDIVGELDDVLVGRQADEFNRQSLTRQRRGGAHTASRENIQTILAEEYYFTTGQVAPSARVHHANHFADGIDAPAHSRIATHNPKRAVAPENQTRFGMGDQRGERIANITDAGGCGT